MSRSRLKEIGVDLPILPTTSVGSFGKPAELVEARARQARGELPEGRLRELEEEATAFWMRTQDELEIDVPVDGEMYRGDMVAYFAAHLRGFRKGGLVRSYGNRFYHKPVIEREVRWEKPITTGWWAFAQKLTKRPVKGMLTGPYTIMDWSFDEHYPDRRSAALALAAEIRKEVDALVESGCRLIQVDEPALSVRPEELPVAIEAMDVVTRGVPAYFFTHCCYGAFEFVYPGMLDLPVDNFDLELSNGELDLLDLFRRHPFTKDLSFGVVDVHTHRVEPEELVRQRIRTALQVIPRDALWIDPDCGLKTRTVEESIAKLRVVVQATRAVRQELDSGARRT
jgi:5-methyltetrahydropteroyltriglutamate--homocysteine methyltransferase